IEVITPWIFEGVAVEKEEEKEENGLGEKISVQAQYFKKPDRDGAIVDDLLSTRIGYATRITLKSYTKEFEKKAQEERKLYTDVVEKSKILLDKIKKSKSFQAALEHKELYDGLVKSYNLDKDLFSSYGNVYSLKRDIQDEDLTAGSN
nr:hypothetical protein [Tanacetum cinerariifolium]